MTNHQLTVLCVVIVAAVCRREILAVVAFALSVAVLVGLYAFLFAVAAVAWCGSLIRELWRG
jgi:hypothetical protein